MSTEWGVGERISLTMRTSWLSEFRTTSGVLVMFDVVGGRTTFGRLCATLATIGVEFAELRIPARFSGPVRFRFRGQDFTMTMEHDDYRVRVLDPLASPSHARELLALLKEQFNKRKGQSPSRQFS